MKQIKILLAGFAKSESIHCHLNRLQLFAEV